MSEWELHAPTDRLLLAQTGSMTNRLADTWRLFSAALIYKGGCRPSCKGGERSQPLFASALRGLSWAKIHWVGREGVEISPLVPSSGSAAFDSLTLWIHHWLSLSLIEQLVRSTTRWSECVLNELLNYGMLSRLNQHYFFPALGLTCNSCVPDPGSFKLCTTQAELTQVDCATRNETVPGTNISVVLDACITAKIHAVLQNIRMTSYVFDCGVQVNKYHTIFRLLFLWF